MNPSDEVVVRRNAQPRITDSANPQDSSCEVATRFDTGKMDPWELVPPQFVFFGKDEAGDDVTIPLRYGNPYQNGGYRHIANEHGWMRPLRNRLR